MSNAESISEDIASETNPVTVGTLATRISQFIERHGDQFPTYVVGEVSDVNEYDFGTFFEFTDPEDDATITCIAWSHAVAGFEDELEPGTAGVVRASVDFYADEGNLQLNVSNFWAHGESARTEEWAELEATLEEEGLIGPDTAQSLPPYPTCIGVVTATGSSAAEDVCEAIHRRHPGTTIKLHDATVQGEDAVPSVVSAVTTLDQAPSVDVIIVTRGGGADATLWSFNEEPLVRCVADLETPTVAAIGHEDDETLVERVADQRCMTPTDAGVTVATDVDQLQARVDRLQSRIGSAYTDVVTDRLEAVDRRISAATDAIVRRVQSEQREQLQRARALEQRIQQSYRHLIDSRLHDYESRITTNHEALQQRVVRERQERQQRAEQAEALETRIHLAYTSLVETRLSALADRIEDHFVQLEHSAETQTLTRAAAVGRVGDLEARVDTAYQSTVDRRVTSLESRIEDAYSQIEADTEIASKETEVQYLRLALIVLLLLLLGVLLLLLI